MWSGNFVLLAIRVNRDCQAVNLSTCQGVKLNFDELQLAAPRAVAPRDAFNGRKDPRTFQRAFANCLRLAVSLIRLFLIHDGNSPVVCSRERGFIADRKFTLVDPPHSAARSKPVVRIGGIELPTTAIREGNFERVDLTLLSVDEQKLPVYLRMRRMPLCENRPWPENRSSPQFPKERCAPRLCGRLFLPLISKGDFPRRLAMSRPLRIHAAAPNSRRDVR